MLTLIIGMLISVCGVYGVAATYNLAFLLLYVIGLSAIVITLFQPLAGFEKEECIKTYYLVPLIPNSEHYVIEDNKGNLMYKYKNQNDEEVIRCSTFADTNYGTGGIKDTPILKEIVLKPKKNLWSLPIFCSRKTQYVLEFPGDKIENTILN